MFVSRLTTYQIFKAGKGYVFFAKWAWKWPSGWKSGFLPMSKHIFMFKHDHVWTWFSCLNMKCVWKNLQVFLSWLPRNMCTMILNYVSELKMSYILCISSFHGNSVCSLRTFDMFGHESSMFKQKTLVSKHEPSMFKQRCLMSKHI